MIEFSHVSKSFGMFKVLNNLSFSINTGELVYIIGRSGEGKSVVMRHMVKLLSPDRGEVKVGGRDLAEFSSEDLEEYRKDVGFLFQHGALFDSKNVLDNVMFPLLERQQFGYKDIQERAKEALAMVGLSSAAKVFPLELSVGEKKRVGLARALVCRPSLMLYDEPTTGLDPILSHMIDSLIMKIQSSYLHLTSVVISHDVQAALCYGERIIMLAGGKVHLQGTPDMFRGSQDAFVRAFIEGAM